MALILLRHTTPDVSAGVCYGRTDLALAESFEGEALEALDALPRFTAIITSPLRRCQKLAAFIGQQEGLEVTIDDRLMEMDFGESQKAIAYINDDVNIRWEDTVTPGKNVIIAFGPEGGFTAAEAQTAKAAGFDWVSLGDYRLRTETAALAALQTIHVVNALRGKKP